MLRAAVAITRSTLLAITAYLGILTVAAARAAKSAPTSSPPTPPRHRFVVMIPAHNEERLIGSTLASLAELDYPAGWVQTHVVTDNSTDGTASIVRATAAELHERDDPDHAGKGPALHWLTARLRERGQLADAVVFIDADTIVDSAFLTVVDRHLTSGAGVVQAHYAVRDVDSTPIVAFRAAAMSARTYLRPLGRTAIGGSAGLHGNGMVFRTDVIEGQRWSDHLTEDVELHLDLLLDGTRVAFAPDARIEAEMPDSLEAARTQHERWERGRLELAARYVPRLVRRTITGGPAGRVAYADAAMDQIVPPLSVVAAADSSVGNRRNHSDPVAGRARATRGCGVGRPVFADARCARVRLPPPDERSGVHVSRVAPGSENGGVEGRTVGSDAVQPEAGLVDADDAELTASRWSSARGSIAVRFVRRAAMVPGATAVAQAVARMVAGSHHVGAMAVVTTIGRDAGTTGPMVLLARHAFKADRWGVLGGWVQRREDPAAVCVREVLEETGLGVRVEDILGCEVHAINGKPLRYGGLTVAYRCSPARSLSVSPDPAFSRVDRRSMVLSRTSCQPRHRLRAVDDHPSCRRDAS